MRLKEFIVEDKSKKKKDKESVTRNYVAKNAQSSGSGAHADKKKDDKQGKVKHKGKELSESVNFATFEIQLIESQLDETTVETFKGGGIVYYWVREAGYDAIIANKPESDGSIGLHIVKIGPPKTVAEVWQRLKQKFAAPEKPQMPKQQPTVNPYIRRTETVGESATAGATSSANIASVPNPHLTVGQTNKAYTGSPGKSGTKAPKQPKMKMQAPGTNALDSNKNIFGTGKVVKR